jgi:hypothetical protein
MQTTYICISPDQSERKLAMILNLEQLLYLPCHPPLEQDFAEEVLDLPHFVSTRR